jgi:hypothetical protein
MPPRLFQFRGNSRLKVGAAGSGEICEFCRAALAEPVRCERIKDGLHHSSSVAQRRCGACVRQEKSD